MIYTYGKRAGFNRLTALHGRDDLQKHEENTNQISLLGGNHYKPSLMGTGIELKTAQGNAWTVDLPKRADTQCHHRDASNSKEGSDPEGD
jgi:hypothetical protein